MSVKEQLLSSFQNLPEQASWAEAEERLRFLAAIDQARGELDRGEGIPHEEVKRQVLSWFRK
jgi:predicted transcriptional regulator